MPLQYVDREDIGGALRRAGSTKIRIDSQDYENVLINELAEPFLRVDNEDMTGIVGGISTDTTAPVNTGFTPADNATGVSINVAPTVAFDVPVVLGEAGLFTLKKTSDNSTIDSWDVAVDAGSGAGQVQISGNNVILHLTAALAAATQYYIIWAAGVVTDLSGTPVAAQASTTAWSFTTA